MMRAAEFLKQSDQFGHEVKLRVRDGNGTKQTTVCGGAITLLMYCFISSYLVVKSIKMIESNMDNITSVEETVNLNQTTKINITGMMPVI